MAGLDYGLAHMGWHIDSHYRAGTIHCVETPGQRIQRIRKAKGLTQMQLATSIQVDQSTISDIESKGADFAATRLMSIARALEVDPAILMEGKSATWPFARIDIARWVALDAPERNYVEGRLEAAIELAEERTGALRKSPPPLKVSSAENPTSEPISEAQDVTPADVVRELRDRGVGDRGSNAQRGQTGRKAKRTHGGRA